MFFNMTKTDREDKIKSLERTINDLGHTINNLEGQIQLIKKSLDLTLQKLSSRSIEEEDCDKGNRTSCNHIGGGGGGGVDVHVSDDNNSFKADEDGKNWIRKLEEALKADDLPKFLSMSEHIRNDHTALSTCLSYRAKKCAIAMLKGEHGDDEPLVRKEYWENKFFRSLDTNPLKMAAEHLCDPEVIELILLQPGVQTNLSKHGVLPIHFALSNLRKLEYLSHWTSEQSIFKLVILLCLPEARKILDSVRLIAERTKGVEDLAFYCVMDRGILEFAALLLAAQEKVMAPMSGDLERSLDEFNSIRCDSKRQTDVAELKLDGKYIYDELPKGHTIIHRILLEFGLLAGEGSDLDQTAHKDLEVCRLFDESRQALWDAYQLILIFKRAGDALSSYVLSNQKNVTTEQIVEEVAFLLMDAGYKLSVEYRDKFDLKDALSVSSLDVGPIRFKGWVCLPPNFSMPNGSLSQVYHNRKLLLEQGGSPFRMKPYGVTSAAFNLLREFHTSRIIASAPCDRAFLVTKEAPLKKFAKPIEQPVAKVSLSNKLGSLMLAAVKKGMTRFI